MSLHKAIHFEAEICQHLAAHGWLYAEGDAAQFDRAHGLFLPDLMAWVETTQPENFQRLTKTHEAALSTALAERVRKNLNECGTLDVLRRGVEIGTAVTNVANTQLGRARDIHFSTVLPLSMHGPTEFSEA